MLPCIHLLHQPDLASGGHKEFMVNSVDNRYVTQLSLLLTAPAALLTVSERDSLNEIHETVLNRANCFPCSFLSCSCCSSLRLMQNSHKTHNIFQQLIEQFPTGRGISNDLQKI
jgi:hypothetical protein